MNIGTGMFKLLHKYPSRVCLVSNRGAYSSNRCIYTSARRFSSALFIRNMIIGKMRLEFGNIEGIFKKVGRPEFQIITLKNCFARKLFN